MPNKNLMIIFLPLILGLFVTTWLILSNGTSLGMIFLLIALVVTSSIISKKHKEAYCQGKITRVIFTSIVLFEIISILLALGISALVGRQLAGIATQHLDNDSTKLIAGIFIGLSVGIVVGLLVKRVSSRLVKLWPGSWSAQSFK